MSTHHHHMFSPSSLPRVELCPGSALMSQRAKEAGLVDEGSEDASEGTMLHGLLDPKKELPATLSDEQREAVLAARAFIARVCAGATEILYEVPMVLRWDEVILTSGTADAVALYPREVRVPEVKFGRVQVSDDAMALQGGTYATMALQLFGREFASVYGCQPRLGVEWDGQVSGTEPTETEIALRVKAIIDHASGQGREVLSPSAQACRHCPGRACCPAFKEAVLDALPAVRADLDLVDPAVVARGLEFGALLEPAVDQYRRLAKALIRSGVEVPGWEELTRKRRTITGADEAFGALEGGGLISQEEFLRCSEVQVGKLERLWTKAWVEAHGGNGGTLEEAKKAFAARLGPLLQVDTEPYLKQVCGKTNKRKKNARE